MMDSPEIVRLYAAGEHLRQIAEKAGVTHEAVRQRLLKAGVTLRPRVGSHRAPAAGGRKASAETVALMEEIAADLPQFPSGAGVDDLIDWLGEDRHAITRAIGVMFFRGTVRIIPADRP